VTQPAQVPAPALVAVAHGSRDPAAAVTTAGLVGAIRQARPGLTVLEAYLDHAQPALSELAVSLTEPFVVVPLLLGAAYHSRVDIPAALAPAGALATQADVLGPDPLLVAALERRLAEAGVPLGDRDTAVVLAAAGSTEASSVEAVRELAAGWRGAGWWAVEPAFASAASPTVESAVAALRGRGAPRVAVATYLLFPGLFADKLASSGADVVAAPLTDAPEVVSLVLARYDATVTGRRAMPAADSPTARTRL
jgi:sirohydrochlorin ferrochelatase